MARPAVPRDHSTRSTSTQDTTSFSLCNDELPPGMTSLGIPAGGDAGSSSHEDDGAQQDFVGFSPADVLPVIVDDSGDVWESEEEPTRRPSGHVMDQEAHKVETKPKKKKKKTPPKKKKEEEKEEPPARGCACTRAVLLSLAAAALLLAIGAGAAVVFVTTGGVLSGGSNNGNTTLGNNNATLAPSLAPSLRPQTDPPTQAPSLRPPTSGGGGGTQPTLRPTEGPTAQPSSTPVLPSRPLSCPAGTPRFRFLDPDDTETVFPTGLTDDDAIQIRLPFDIKWLGTDLRPAGSNIWIASNGQINMDENDASDNCCDPDPLDGTSYPFPRIAVAQADLIPGHVLLGLESLTATSFLVSFQNAAFHPGTGVANVQAELFADGRVHWCFGPGFVPENGSFATGLEDNTVGVHVPLTNLTDVRFDKRGLSRTWPTGACYCFHPDRDLPKR